VGGDSSARSSCLRVRSFNPRPPRGGRRQPRCVNPIEALFQSTPPAWGATPDLIVPTGLAICFNPRPPRGGRPQPPFGLAANLGFQSTPPAWGATPIRAGTQDAIIVSIHAPRVGGDKIARVPRNVVRSFNPRPPRGGRQSPNYSASSSSSFNPRPPRGGRQQREGGDTPCLQFQSTPPAWGATTFGAITMPHARMFQSTPPAWGATSTPLVIEYGVTGFNPRPPRGGRPQRHDSHNADSGFQSTPPAWGATQRFLDGQLFRRVSIHAPRVGGDRRDHRLPWRGKVSIHAPRVGGDWSSRLAPRWRAEFQSTPPAWGATLINSWCNSFKMFQSTPPAWGATYDCQNGSASFAFQSTPPAWGATIYAITNLANGKVSIHAPRVGGDPYWVV